MLEISGEWGCFFGFEWRSFFDGDSDIFFGGKFWKMNGENSKGILMEKIMEIHGE
jgi:hypothetical protein